MPAPLVRGSQNLDDKMGWLRRSESIAVERELLKGLPELRLSISGGEPRLAPAGPGS
jgi:hypothetical protein